MKLPPLPPLYLLAGLAAIYGLRVCLPGLNLPALPVAVFGAGLAALGGLIALAGLLALLALLASPC